MNDRLKILGIFATLGFVGGMVANVALKTVWPWLVANFSMLFASELVVSGVAGAVITTCFVVIWVYLTQPKEQ